MNHFRESTMSIFAAMMAPRALSRVASKTLLALAVSTAAMTPLMAEDDALVDLAERIQVDASNASEADLLRLLELASQEGRALEAATAVDTWLSNNFTPSPAVLLAAARNARQAGNLRTAGERYSAFFERAEPAADTGQAAAEFLTLTAMLLGESNAPYQFFLRNGLRFRNHPAVQRFDHWLIDEALLREDLSMAIEAINAMIVPGLDQGIERIHYHPKLLQIAEALFVSRQPTVEAADQLQSVVERARLREAEKSRLLFLLEMTRLAASRLAGDERFIQQYLGAGYERARAFLSAQPTLESYREVLRAFAHNPSNGRWSNDQLEELGDRHARLVVALLERASDGQKKAIFAHRFGSGEALGAYAADPLTWYRVGAREGRLFIADSFSRSGAFADTSEEITRQIGTLNSVVAKTPGAYAAAVRALHAGGGDPARTAEAWFAAEAWALDARTRLDLWSSVIEPALATRMDLDDGISDEMYAKSIAPWVGKSVRLRYDRNAMRDHLKRSFDGDRTNLPERINEILWIPLSSDVRNRGVSDFIRHDFGRWRDWVRKAGTNERDRKHEEAKPLLPLAERLQGSVDVLGGASDIDASKAPNALARAWAEAVQAAERNQHQEAANALKQVAAAVADGPSKDLPQATAILDDILSSDRWSGPAYAAQLEVLAAALRGWRNESGPHEMLLRSFMGRTRDWWGRTRREDRDAVLAAHEILAQALRDAHGRGSIPPTLLTAFFDTRRGRNWRESEVSQDIFATILEGGTLWTAGTTVVEAMRLVRNDFASLRERFPIESYFDERMVIESQERNHFDYDYWEFGRDERGLVRRAAWDHFGGNIPPLAGTGSLRVYDDENHRAWMHRILVDGVEHLGDAALDSFEGNFADRKDVWAAGLAWFRRSTPENDLGEFRMRAANYLAAASVLPSQVPGIDLRIYENIEAADFTDADRQLLSNIVVDLYAASWPSNAQVGETALKLARSLKDAGDHAAMRRAGPALWRLAEQTNGRSLAAGLLDILKEYVRDEQTEMISSFGGAGVDIAQEVLNDNQRRDIESIVATARSVMGPAINIPESDPRYPVYAAQQNWSIGRNQGAWEMIARPGADELTRELVGELNPQFLLWTVAEYTRRERLEEADLLCRALLTWMDSVNVPLPAEFRAETLLARARVAMQRGALPVARAQFRVIAEDETFVGLPQRTTADLLTAEVDRLSGRFDEADDILRRLARSPDTNVRANALFYQAKIRMDQEDAEAARRLLDRAMTLNTTLEMVFFQKELQLALRDFLSARRWGWGSGNDRLIPGRMLEIAIEDRNRVIARNFSSIELRVWSEDSGDEETLILTMADDRGELFTGELPTELGPARQGDRRLQILGGDTIHYDLSEEFVRRVNFERTGPTEQTVQVASDAELLASSGTILSREERQRLAEESLFRPKERDDAPLSERRAPNQIRPGNAINVQVIDPSRSTTLQPDRISIQVAASSGDRIGNLELVETGSSSGVFEGAVPTTRLPARAFASDTAAGSDPNVIISPSDNLPSWVAATGVDGPRYVGVDFNDLIDFKEFIVEGDEQSRIRRIVVESSLNNRDFQPIAAWPDAVAHWQGEPQVTMAVLPGQQVGNSYSELSAFLQRSATDPRYGVQSQALPGEGFALRWQGIEESWKKLPAVVPGLDASNSRGRRGDDPGVPVLVRARGAFWVDERQTFTFYLTNDSSSDLAQPRLFVNGQQLGAGTGGRPSGSDAQELQVELGRGLHVLEIMRVVGRNQGQQITTELRTASSSPPYIVPVERSFFDVSPAGPLLADRFPAPTTMSESGSNNRFVVDMVGRSTRTLRVWLMEVEGGVPAVRKLHVTTANDQKILPLEQDFDELRRNEILEIGAGDRITLTYNDPTPFNDNNSVHEAFLQANYHNASVVSAFPVSNERGQEQMAAVRRFEPGDPIRVLITDFDRDVTSEADSIRFRVQTSSGRTVELDAVETGPHTGVFLGAFFPVEREPSRASEVQVVTGDDITITYRDDENTDPGIPWDRINVIEQVVWREPELRVANTRSEPLAEAEIAAAEAARERARETAREQGLPTTEIDAQTVPRFMLLVERPSQAATVGQAVDELATHVLGANLQVEVLWPTAAKSSASRVTIYAQTSSGRAAADVLDDEPFDTSVPGTVAFEVGASTITAASTLPDGHARGPVVGTQLLGSAMDQGAFTASIPVRFGDNPNESLVGRPDLTEDQRTLLINAEDTIFIAFVYEDEEGREQWLTRRVGLSGSALFEVYDRTWTEAVTEFHVGESIYLQATDPLSNISGERDQVSVEVSTASGWSGTLRMIETLSHTGVFRTVATFIHNEATAEREDLNAIPVTYGDTVTIRYPGRGGMVERQLIIHKGADGEVVPFSKRYQDDEMAMGTLFSIAEAYFELAKQQRAMAEDATNRADTAGEARFQRQVRDSIDAGRDVLEEAIRQFPDSALRAQADYLMAELELEFAADTQSEDDKRRYHENALQRFSSILGSYPDSEYAPRAQYKLGFVYEEMGEMTAASQEYVKLSFRYPDHELVADAMIRLARYFQGEGRRIEAEAARLTETDFPRSQVLQREARSRFGTAGDVLSRLIERFPTHPNAAAAGVAAGTSYISAHRFEEATTVLDLLANDPTIDAPMIKAEALYWLGDAYLKMMEFGKVPRGVDARGRAEIAFTTCTVNYPESLWARRSRGVLDELARKK